VDRDGSPKLLSWVVVLGALLAFVVYVLVRFYSLPPFCTYPACVTMLRFSDSSMVSAVAALGCVVLSTFLWPRLFLVAAGGALIVSVMTGFGTGAAFWPIVNILCLVVPIGLLLMHRLDR
jgi:hypothetical protein